MKILATADEITKFILEFCADKNASKVLFMDTEVANWQPNKKGQLSIIQIFEASSSIARQSNSSGGNSSAAQQVENQQIQHNNSIALSDLYNSVIVLDMLSQPKSVLTMFTDCIMANENFEKVFHYATFDLGYLGGPKKCKNVTCTLKLARQIPAYALPVQNYKLSTLVKHLVPQFNLIVVEAQVDQKDSIDVNNEHNNIQQEQQQQLHLNEEVNKIAEDLQKLEISKEEEAIIAQKDSLQASINWNERPLSVNSLKYACNDVIFLSYLYPKLLHLLEKHVLIDPNTDDISQLEERIKEMELIWKRMESEKEQLTERLKNAMLAQQVNEGHYYKISGYEKVAHFSPFHVIAKVAEKNKVTLNSSIMLTRTIQDEFVKQNASQALYDLMHNSQLCTRQSSMIHRLYPKKSEKSSPSQQPELEDEKEE